MRYLIERTALALAIAIASMRPAMALDVGAMVEKCNSCHGPDGVSAESEIPTIAGYSAEYVSAALQAYQKKERPCPEAKYGAGPHKGEPGDMCRSVEGMSESDADRLGKYFEGKKFVRAQQPFDAALAAKGKELHDSNCEKCHLEAGTVKSDDAGILAGQHTAYLRTQFDAIKSGKRVSPKRMKPKIDVLSPSDVDALLNYYASFK